ncbi:hypothetical protein JOEDIRT_114 [Mycobacterium phage JoeDirt]|uniref:Uncharacterized protein n=2 Tax=Mycobacterium virus JoeDirt TaxID=1034137 RepID=G1BQN6_9CAUD|nr:hypothetical protein FGG55_gp122 [Mycobacterium phage JoeDirt]AEK07147.1 hypothetical protein JOEDIRT_114 [Mycobacterium phage JoeDirt]AYD82281.1 hypothetical protein SEA_WAMBURGRXPRESS_113 [Mycobacterium phage Wamburgrxpress]QGJ92509.1 hypothetical protein SEA_WYATT2_114 [Mycobacterium phage Wyatt2]
MMKRETLIEKRHYTNKFDYYVSLNDYKQVIDSHIEALDTIHMLRAEISGLRRVVRKCEEQYASEMEPPSGIEPD